MSRRFNHRPGAALMWALVSVTVVGLLLTVMTTQVVAGRRVIERREDQLRATWLAREGVERAAARLLTKPASKGGDSQESGTGTRLRVEVRPEPGARDSYRITSEARLHADGPTPVARTLHRRMRRLSAGAQVHVDVLPLEDLAAKNSPP
jgi:hypothetical protein